MRADRDQRKLVWLALPTAVLAGLLVLLLATRQSAEQRNASSPILGGLAPAIVGVTTAGEHFDLDDWRGRWVLVNFFSTTCVPCVIEHPELVAFSERHAGAGDHTRVDDRPGAAAESVPAEGGAAESVPAESGAAEGVPAESVPAESVPAEGVPAEIVSVVFDDSAANVREFFAANGGDWPVLAEGAGTAAIGYGVTGVPESYLVAPSGAVVWKQLGGVTADAIDGVIARLLAAA